jgi:hypothetical protein
VRARRGVGLDSAAVFGSSCASELFLAAASFSAAVAEATADCSRKEVEDYYLQSRQKLSEKSQHTENKTSR